MTQYQSALSTLIGEVLADPDLAHQDARLGRLTPIEYETIINNTQAKAA